MRHPPASHGPVFAPPGRRVVDSVTVLLPVPPSVNRIYRHTKERGPVRSDAYKSWIDGAGWRLQAQRPGRVPGPYVLLLAVPRTSRMDIDNAAKAISDLLQKHGVVDNDRDAVRVLLEWHAEHEEVAATVRGLSGGPALEPIAPVRPPLEAVA
ncbi:MAG: RusA family crossover junction endodeoxyribonuclease [Hyphomicrobiales bacterium]|jgi:crossover junction endodeoxyribonuclease RusA